MINASYESAGNQINPENNYRIVIGLNFYSLIVPRKTMQAAKPKNALNEGVFT